MMFALGATNNDGTNRDRFGHVVRIYELDIFNLVQNQIGADIDGKAASDSSRWWVFPSANGTTVFIGAYWLS